MVMEDTMESRERWLVRERVRRVLVLGSGSKSLVGKSYGHELVRKYSSFFLLLENDVEDIV